MFFGLLCGCLGRILEALGGVLEALGDVLEAPRGVLEASWRLLEALGGILEASWRHLEASWRHLGGVLEAMLRQDRFWTRVGWKNPSENQNFGQRRWVAIAAVPRAVISP